MAMRSVRAAKMPSTSGCRSSSSPTAVAAGAAEVTLRHQRRWRWPPASPRACASRRAGRRRAPCRAGRRPWRSRQPLIRWAQARRAPPTLSASTKPMADVQGPVAGMPGDDARDPGGDEPAGQRVVATGRQQQHAVRVAPQQQALDALPIRLVLDHQQHQLVARAGQRGGDPADRSGEEWIPEQAGARLGDRQGDGIAAVGRQAPRRDWARSRAARSRARRRRGRRPTRGCCR